MTCKFYKFFSTLEWIYLFVEKNGYYTKLMETYDEFHCYLLWFSDLWYDNVLITFKVLCINDVLYVAVNATMFIKFSNVLLHNQKMNNWPRICSLCTDHISKVNYRFKLDAFGLNMLKSKLTFKKARENLTNFKIVLSNTLL